MYWIIIAPDVTYFPSKFNNLNLIWIRISNLQDDDKLSELYSGLEMEEGKYFDNGIALSVWSVDYYWRKLREKVLSPKI